MSIRLFISCDICNTDGLLICEERKAHKASRRHSDDRAAISGNSQDSNICYPIEQCSTVYSKLARLADRLGWYNQDNQLHICPQCYDLHKQDLGDFDGDVTHFDVNIIDHKHRDL